MIKKLYCPKCLTDVEVCLSESGPHTKASCNDCGSYIKFLSQTELKGEKTMADAEITIPIAGSEYNELIVINKYGDKYSLVLGGKSKTGQVFMKWCFPQGPDKLPREKSVPWKITLGNSVEAKETVTAIARAFGIIGNSPNLPESRGGIPKADISPPFEDEDPNIPF